MITAETAAHGTHSLKLMNPTGMDAIQVFFPAREFKERTHLVVSFYAKASVEKTPLLAGMLCGWKRVIEKNIDLGKDWARYQFEGDVGVDFVKESSAGGARGMYALTLSLFSAKKPVFGDVWIDAIQIERQALTEYAPAKTLEATLDFADFPNRRSLVYFAGEKPEAVLTVASTRAVAAAEARITVKDTLGGQVLFDEKKSVALDAKGQGSVRVSLPAVARRHYRIEAVVTSGGGRATAQRVFGGIVDLSKNQIRSKRFGGSIEMMEEARAYYMAPADPSYRMAAYREKPEVYASLARKIGWQWIHFYGQVGIGMVAPEKGKYQWRDADACTDLYLKLGLEIMALTTSHGNYQGWYFEPKWILTGPKSLGGNNAGKDSPLVNAEDFGRFCFDLAEHFKGRIDLWESWNEPGVKMRAEEYLPLLAACYTNMKRANPASSVLGLCGTWDMGGDLYGWVKRCLALGAGKYMDEIGIHGYHTKDRDYIARVRATAKELTGKEWKVWDTESGSEILQDYGYPAYFNWESPTEYRFDGLLTMLSKHYANEMASGVERQSWFNLIGSYGWIGKPDYALMNYDGSPNAAMMGQNYLIEQYEGARLHREVPVEGGTVAYVFQKGNEPFLVYWNETLETEGSLPIEGVQVLDMMGGRLPVRSEGGTTLLKIDKTPRYVTAAGMGAEALASAVGRITVRGASALKLGRISLSVSGETPLLVASVKNTGAQPQRLEVETISKPAWVSAGVRESRLLPGFTNLDLSWRLPMTLPGDDNLLRLAFEVPSGTLVANIPLNIQSARRGAGVLIDGLAGDSAWNGALWGPIGHFATMASSYDEKSLHFFFKVKDNEVVNYRDYSATALPSWKTDGVELYFDLDREGDFSQSTFNQDDLQLAFAVKCGPASKDEVNKGPDVYAGNKNFPADKVSMKTTRSGEGYLMEIGIPWECFSALGYKKKSLIGFAASVRDLGKNYEERARAFWAGDNDNYRDTSKFGLLLLMP
ncbi:MAG: hypothetical protein J0L75_12145 [Spirochaetes bacterium]|nr:hypothetical protein [Spirochaetota bacterium]